MTQLKEYPGGHYGDKGYCDFYIYRCMLVQNAMSYSKITAPAHKAYNCTNAVLCDSCSLLRLWRRGWNIQWLMSTLL